MDSPTIGGIPADEIEARLIAILEELVERNEISLVDQALRLTEMARRAGRAKTPRADTNPRPDHKLTFSEQVVLVRACLSAGVDVPTLRVEFAAGVLVPDGTGRRCRMGTAEFDRVLAKLADSGRIDERRRSMADALRTVELERLARIAAREEGRNPMAALKASQLLLDRLDEYAPARTPPLEDRVEGLLGIEAVDVRELEREYATLGDDDEGGSDVE